MQPSASLHSFCARIPFKYLLCANATQTTEKGFALTEEHGLIQEAG